MKYIIGLLVFWGAVHAEAYNGILVRADEQYSRRSFTAEGLRNAEDARYNYRKVTDRNFSTLESQYALGKYLMANFFVGENAKSTPADTFLNGVSYGQRAIQFFEKTYGRNLNAPSMDDRARKIFAHVISYYAMNLHGWEKTLNSPLATEWKKVERYWGLVRNWGFDHVNDYAYERLLARRAYENRDYANALSRYQTLFNGTVNRWGISRLGEINYYLFECLSKTGGHGEDLLKKVASFNDLDATPEHWPETKYFHSLMRQMSSSEIIPGEFLIKLDSDLLMTQTLTSQKSVSNVEPVSDRVVLVRRPSVELPLTSLHQLARLPGVKYVEPNVRIWLKQNSVNDPFYDKTWGIKNLGQLDPKGLRGIADVDIKAEEAWKITQGSQNLVVGVLDTGIDLSHEDLSANAWVNETEKNGQPGVDDDNNGYVDDINGFDFINNTPVIVDDHGHGTHVAGIIGASANNGKGIAGVAWNVRLMSLKFLSAHGGGDMASALKAIGYATKMGAHLTNNSWGTGQNSNILKEAIEEAGKKGILFVAAAGNDGVSVEERPSYPAAFNLANTISVAAIDARGDLASFSSYSQDLVDVAAPGQNIYSTLPGNKYDAWSGTSMASPYVAGVAALLLAHEPGLTPLEIKNRISRTASPLMDLEGKVKSGGLVNAYRALVNQVSPPNQNDPSRWTRVSKDIESSHPYGANSDQDWEVRIENARQIAIHFKKLDIEEGFDRLYIMDSQKRIVGVMTSNKENFYSSVVEGQTVYLRLVTDKTIHGSGFVVDFVANKE